jgi:hypothetical protein
MPTPEDTVLCPSCARPNAASAPRCARCGELLPAGVEDACGPPPKADADDAGTAEVSASALRRHASSLLGVDDLAATIPLYLRMLQADADNAMAFDQLEALFRTSGRWVDLLHLYMDVAARSTVLERKARLLERAAALGEERLGDAMLAIQQYEQLRALVPDHRAAFDALERLYQAIGDDEKLAALRSSRR